MLPSKGDTVKFTSTFVSSGIVNWASTQKDAEMQVTHVKLKTLTPKPEYDVFLLSNGNLNAIPIFKDGTYVSSSVSGVPVFDIVEDNELLMIDDDMEFSSGYEDFDSGVENKVDETDKCASCGVMGEVKGMACICPSCGKTIWGC